MKKLSRHPRPAPVKPYLSPRESEVVALLAQGQIYTDIAVTLSLSPWTIRAFLRTARARMGAATLAELVYRAYKGGLITVPTPTEPPFLNKWELGILQTLAAGGTVRAAALAQNLAEGTAKRQLSELRRRLRADTNVEVLALALAAGVIK